MIILLIRLSSISLAQYDLLYLLSSLDIFPGFASSCLDGCPCLKILASDQYLHARREYVARSSGCRTYKRTIKVPFS